MLGLDGTPVAVVIWFVLFPPVGWGGATLAFVLQHARHAASKNEQTRSRRGRPVQSVDLRLA